MGLSALRKVWRQLITAAAFRTPRVLASYVFLLGMIGIGAGAYALREAPLQPPQPPAMIATRLLPPSVDLAAPGAPVLASRVVGAKPPAPLPPAVAHPLFDGAAPQRVSRVYLGQPPAVPPNWPSRSPAAQPSPDLATPAATRPTLRPASFAAAPPQSVQPPAPLRPVAAVRPRLRPDGVAGAALPAPATAPTTAPLPAPAVVAAAPALGAMRQGACPARLARAVPRRAGSAPSAAAVLARVQDIDGSQRDRVLEAEIRGGNMPAFLRNLVPVTLNGPGPDGKKVQITLCVMPDYLAVGDDRNFVRVPFGLPSAMRIATDFDMVLPTPQMVDLIYRASDVRLQPSPMPPGAAMTTTAYFQRHNATVEAQRQASGGPAGLLVSGHKKDVVLTRRLSSMPGRVAIYGWHRRNGKPIQPLSTVHGAQYADYSHGIRLVSRNAVMDGRQVDLLALIQDPRYAALLTKEGPMSPRLFAAK